MKMKKLLATLMAMSLAIVPMTVSAEELTAPGEGTDSTITGDVYYENTTVYKVTLPTTSALTFALDPQGLTTLTGGAGGASAGTIVGTGAMTAKNESSVDIKLTGKFYITDSANKVTLLGATDSIDNTKPQICLKIVTEAGSGSAATAPTNAAGFTGDSVVVTGTTAETATKLDATMDKATYKFDGSTSAGFTYTLDSTADDASMLFMGITGSVATGYDWSDYSKTTDPETLTLNAVFGFSDPAVVVDRSPSIAATATYDVSDSSADITVDLGAGSLATTISTVACGGTAANAGNSVLTNEYYELGTGKVTIKNMSSWTAGSTKYVKITLANGNSQVVTITVQE